MTSPPPPSPAWRVYLQAPVLRMLLLGFGAALPWVLIYGTLSFRLREAGIALSTIGYMSWVALVYPMKWLWSPLLARLRIPVLTRRLGRRRAWLLVAQLAAMAGLLAMALFDPQRELPALVACAFLTALAGATQDVALDAYRIESAALEQQAAMAAMYQAGYRVGMIWAGAGALWIAAAAADMAGGYHPEAWRAAYAAMAASMTVGVLANLLSSERPHGARAGADAAAATSGPDGAGARLRRLLEPFADFARRYRWHALLLLALVSAYRFPNILMGIMANPFYHDLGFSKEQVAAVSKLYGVAMALAGGFVGGALTLRVGLGRMMWVAAALSSASILLYALLAAQGARMDLFILAVSVDNFTEGIAGTVFIAYLSGLTNRAYSATQYAVLSSAMVFVPKFAGGFSGRAVEAWGYATFFCGCAACGLLALALVWAVQRNVPGQRFSKR